MSADETDAVDAPNDGLGDDDGDGVKQPES